MLRIKQQMREKFSSEMLLRLSEITVSSTQKVFRGKMLAVVETHLDNEQFSVEQLGDEIGMSRTQTHRKIRALTNLSPSEFIRNFRLQRAAELIRQDVGNMAEIAYQVGSAARPISAGVSRRLSAIPLPNTKKRSSPDNYSSIKYHFSC